jgi:DNA-binding response OmpR family regulator
MSELKMLIADDNKQITSVLSQYAKNEGYSVLIANDGQEALDSFRRNKPDIILLDVMMPVLDGFQVCREIRRESSVPIIMITARGEDFEKIMGLDIGADDYIVKPFSPREVVARIKAILRRTENHPAGEDSGKNVIQHNGLLIDLNSYTVLLRGEPVICTPKEIEILFLLASNPGHVFTRDTLLSKVWGYDFAGETRTVDTHIKRLRAKLDSAGLGWSIKTIYGVGYKFELE